jgi:hypothetical protein
MAIYRQRHVRSEDDFPDDYDFQEVLKKPKSQPSALSAVTNDDQSEIMDDDDIINIIRAKSLLDSTN